MSRWIEQGDAAAEVGDGASGAGKRRRGKKRLSLEARKKLRTQETAASGE